MALAKCAAAAMQAGLHRGRQLQAGARAEFDPKWMDVPVIPVQMVNET